MLQLDTRALMLPRPEANSSLSLELNNALRFTFFWGSGRIACVSHVLETDAVFCVF